MTIMRAGVDRLLLIMIMMTTVTARQFNLGMLMPRRHVRLGWDKNAAAATMAIEKAEEDGVLYGNTARYDNDAMGRNLYSGDKLNRPM